MHVSLGGETCRQFHKGYHRSGYEPQHEPVETIYAHKGEDRCEEAAEKKEESSHPDKGLLQLLVQIREAEHLFLFVWAFGPLRKVLLFGRRRNH